MEHESLRPLLAGSVNSQQRPLAAVRVRADNSKGSYRRLKGISARGQQQPVSVGAQNASEQTFAAGGLLAWGIIGNKSRPASV